MILSARLKAVLSLIDRCDVLADIGCDHGKLALAACKDGLCRVCLLSDISSGSLKKARQLFDKEGCGDKAEFFVGDGLSALSRQPDTCIIAGMGGYQIINIIKQSPFKCSTYILQPMKNSDLLRAFLCRVGYSIVYDRVVRDGGKFYDIIKAKYIGEGQVSGITRNQILFGATNLEDMHPDFKAYLDYVITKSNRILAGRVSGKRRDELSQLAAAASKLLEGAAAREFSEGG